MGKAMPGCGMRRDCFVNEGGRCACLKDNDFGGRECPFYKPAETLRREWHGQAWNQQGGLAYGNQQM